MGILLSHKVDFRAKKSGRDKEENYVMIKGSIHHDDIILNGAPNKRTSKYIKQNLIVLKDAQIHNYGFRLHIPLSVISKARSWETTKDKEFKTPSTN